MIKVIRLIGRILCVLYFVMIAIPVSASNSPIDDAVWTNILQTYVNEHGMVDYDGLLVNRQSFDQYISSIEKVSPKTNPELFSTRNQKLAYYINAYNAMVFKGVLNRGPEKQSVWKGLISGLNFFVRMDITIGAEETNLKSLEDDIVRDQFKDPRIHAALNCASVSCPRLPQKAFSANALDQQLEDAMIEFVNTEANIQIDHTNQKLYLSKIFDWFESDFIEHEKSQGNIGGSKNKRIIDYVNRYRGAKDQIPSNYKLTHLDYDKGINDQR